MFVSDGAKTIIKEVRKENFKHNFVKNLLQEANKLEINREELVDIIINFKED